MKVVICGAGQVGYNLASYLAEEGHHVTVVDHDPHLIERVGEDLDVNAIVGFASDPDILDAANAGDCDLMIAMTRSDEVNMMACQVGHSLFSVPKKIARVREQNYLKPEWANLFSRKHMPIDVIVSPEIIVAEDIYERLSVPGATFASSLAGGKVHLLGVVAEEDCPIVGTPLNQIEALFPHLTFRIIAILRAGETIIAQPDSFVQASDEVFFVVDTAHLKRVMQAFGFDREDARRIVIAGGGNVGEALVRLLKERGRGTQVRLIEQDAERAQYLSEEFGHIVVLNGSSLERDILDQASIAKVDTFIAVTNDDETNILSSLLAKQYGTTRSVTLVNNQAYSPLVGPLGVDAMVSPRAIIAAAVMKHVRRGRIRDIHNLRHGGFAEIIEAEVSENCQIANMTVGDDDIPKEIVIVGMIRDGEFILPKDDDEQIRPGDHTIVLVPQEHAQAVEKLFSVQVDIF